MEVGLGFVEEQAQEGADELHGEEDHQAHVDFLPRKGIPLLCGVLRSFSHLVEQTALRLRGVVLWRHIGDYVTCWRHTCEEGDDEVADDDGEGENGEEHSEEEVGGFLHTFRPRGGVPRRHPGDVDPDGAP